MSAFYRVVEHGVLATAPWLIASFRVKEETMRRKLLAFASLAIAASGLMLYAQFGPRELYRPESVTALVDRVHEDLNRGYEVWHLSNGDRDRLTHAEHQLRNFSRDWSRGRFDKDDLDQSIAAVQHVLDNNRLNGRERDALWSDVEQLRRMREAYDRHEIGGR
jgi:hypothetical protein